MKLRFQIYVEEHEITCGKQQQHHITLKKNTCKPHILFLALCKYEDSIRDKRREALETRRKHH